ncbi:galanin receptor type 1-like [Acanthaster planci]|uniref:Galanin receptor type 1-like n=1 Tax=Acanthaster planci TaxID=133434 RepID=A0A8B7Z658_ACAPL|nr:galanin receptor type 1-like [Acanthaster planci]
MTTESYGDMLRDRGWSAEGSFEDQVWLRAVYGVIAVLGITGNALVMFTVARVPSLRSLTNMFIVSLAMCDFITSVFLIPLHLGFSIPVPDGVAGDIICRLLLSKFPLWTSFVASVLTLTCVTLERYCSIVHPFRYEALFTHRKAIAMIICIWAMAVLMNSYFFYIFYSDGGRCIIQWQSTVWQKFVGVANFCVIYIFPLSLMGFSYWRIMHNLHKSAQTMRQSTSEGRENQLSRDLLRARKKVVKMLLTVVATFAVCWAPNQFLFFSYMCGWNLDFSSWYYHASVLIAFCNSCMNPFIYGFQSKQHRKALRRAFGCSNAVGARALEGASNLSFVHTADVKEFHVNAMRNLPTPRNTEKATQNRSE